MSNLLIPPSINWFQPNGVSVRTDDRLLATACFKSIVVYKVSDDKLPLTPLKLIPFSPSKALGVCLYPDLLNPDFGHTVAVIGDGSRLALIDIHSGNILGQNKFNTKSLNSVCWGHLKGDDLIVAVGADGFMVVWQPKHSVSKTFTLEAKKNMTLVKTVPHLTSQVLVACDRTILQVSLQSGDVLSRFKGHDSAIYDISCYYGDKNPLGVDALPKNTRWKLDDEPRNGEKDNVCDEREAAVSGPWFASSDLGRRILVWDLSAKRYLADAAAPYSTLGYKKGGKDKSQGKNHHISLSWCQNRLYSSTVVGEIIEWNLSTSKPVCKMQNHTHTRAVYNMIALDNLLITSSQDRTIQAYDVASSSLFFNVPTIGTCPNSMAFSPHDANRLAIGMQDEVIKLVTFGGKTPLKMHYISNIIKGRVLTLAWHPKYEGKILFGTFEGQVGIADIFSNKVTTFASFHQKPAYKVEWGPALAPQVTGLNEEWYAYSFGDRELLCRNSSNLMDDPLSLNSFLRIEKNSNNGFCLTEFSFSPDFKFLALGSFNGHVKIMKCSTLQCLVEISRVRKVIQHLAWKPPVSSESSPVLGIASGENSVFIFDMEDKLEVEKVEKPVKLTQPNVELAAHAGRVIWLSWSPHIDGQLASASYDHTVQIWDTNTGDPILNYGGHTHRVFRVEFSPVDSDKVLSFAEENCIHEWQPSKLSTRTPSESAAFLREIRKKNQPCSEEGEDSEKGGTKEASTSNSTKSNDEANSSSSVSARKIAPKKCSSFPLLHSVTVRKKNFHHMCLLSLLQTKLAEKKNSDANLENLDDDLDDDFKGVSSNQNDVKGFEANIEESLKRFSHFMPSDQAFPETEDVCLYLNFFGPLPDMDKVVKKEIRNHESNENFSRANLMHCWQGSLESHIRWAAKHKRLSDFLVASAPQVSFELWEFACEAYAEQLAEADDPVTAATYLVSIHKDEEAVNLLIKHKLFREALTLAKYKMGFNHDALQKVLTAWYNSAVFEGNFEIGAVLQLSLGNFENAARALARRTEPSSLIVAACIFLSSNCVEMAHSTAVLAFKEASSKHEYSKFAPILKEMPNLLWCQCIHLCHQRILQKIATIRSALSSSTSFLPSKSDQDTFPQIVRRDWIEDGITSKYYAIFFKEIRENVPSQKNPTSLKNLWFLISVSLTEMCLLAECEDSVEAQKKWEESLDSILKCIRFWGKADQIFYLTHTLLSNGVDNLEVLDFPLKSGEVSTSTRYLQGLYILSEAQTVLSLLNSDESYVPWKENTLCKHESRSLDPQDHATVSADEVVNGIESSVNLSDVNPSENAVQPDVGTLEGSNNSTSESTESLKVPKVHSSETVDELTCIKPFLYVCKDDFVSTLVAHTESIDKYFLSDSESDEFLTVISSIISLLKNRCEFDEFSHLQLNLQLEKNK